MDGVSKRGSDPPPRTDRATTSAPPAGQRRGKRVCGVFQTQPAQAGQRYQFTVLTKVTEAGAGRGQISLEWRTDDRELGRVWGPSWPLTETDRVWQEQFVRGTAPEGATQVRVVVTLFLGDEAGTSGVCLVDDATLTKP